MTSRMNEAQDDQARVAQQRVVTPNRPTLPAWNDQTVLVLPETVTGPSGPTDWPKTSSEPSAARSEVVSPFLRAFHQMKQCDSTIIQLDFELKGGMTCTEDKEGLRVVKRDSKREDATVSSKPGEYCDRPHQRRASAGRLTRKRCRTAVKYTRI